MALAAISCVLSPITPVQATAAATLEEEANNSNYLRRDLKKNNGGSGNYASLRPQDGNPVFGPAQLAQLQGQAQPDVTVTITRNTGDRTNVDMSGK